MRSTRTPVPRHLTGGWTMKNGNQELEQMCAELDAQEAAKLAERMNDRLNELDSHVTMLRALGVDVNVSLRAQEDTEKDSLEVGEAGCRAKIYCDLNDPDNVTRKLNAAREMIEEARAKGLTPAPKQPRTR